MENKKAEEEVSALITGVMLIGMVIPVGLVWLATRLSMVTDYLVDLGVFERSERVILALSDDAGLDIGRILIACGAFLILMTACKAIFISVRKNTIR